MNEIKKFLENFEEIKIKSAISINNIENEFDIKLPNEIKYFWLHCSAIKIDYGEVYASPHEGIEYYTETVNDLFFNFEEFNNDVDRSVIPKQVKPLSYSKKWIPLFCLDGLFLFFDLDPSDVGLIGQIICKDMMGGDDEIILVANSLNDLFININTEIDNKNVEIRIENKCIKLIPCGGFDLMGKLIYPED